MAYLLKFGTYTLPSGLAPVQNARARAAGAAKTPKADGSRVVSSYAADKVLAVRGNLIKGPFSATAIRDQLDALYGGILGQSGPQKLYYGDSERYYREVVLSHAQDDYGEREWLRIAQVALTFLSGDPFLYADTPSSNTEAVAASGETWTVTAGGNAYALPEFEITVGGAGAQTIAFTVTNQTTGEAFTLAGAVTGGDVILVDSLLKTVKIGSTDKMTLFDGQWPRLNVGGNTLHEAYTSGAITQVKTDWNNRYWG